MFIFYKTIIKNEISVPNQEIIKFKKEYAVSKILNFLSFNVTTFLFYEKYLENNHLTFTA
jgi:hypothetical protein